MRRGLILLATLAVLSLPLGWEPWQSRRRPAIVGVTVFATAVLSMQSLDGFLIINGTHYPFTANQWQVLGAGTHTVAVSRPITVKVDIVGGGAGGGNNDSLDTSNPSLRYGSAGSGGGAGATATKNSYQLLPGHTYTLVVGAAGASDTAGGASSFVDTTASVTVLSVNGGSKGNQADDGLGTNYALGGSLAAGGTVVVGGDVSAAGGHGGAGGNEGDGVGVPGGFGGVISRTAGGGGGGGGGNGSDGGDGGNGTNAGNPGAVGNHVDTGGYGGLGGGAQINGSGNYGYGGQGAAGNTTASGSSGTAGGAGGGGIQMFSMV